MNNLVAIFVAVFLGAMVVTLLGGGERNWGYVTLGALILAAASTAIYVLVRRLTAGRDRLS